MYLYKFRVEKVFAKRHIEIKEMKIQLQALEFTMQILCLQTKRTVSLFYFVTLFNLYYVSNKMKMFPILFLVKTFMNNASAKLQTFLQANGRRNNSLRTILIFYLLFIIIFIFYIVTSSPPL